MQNQKRRGREARSSGGGRMEEMPPVGRETWAGLGHPAPHWACTPRFVTAEESGSSQKATDREGMVMHRPALQSQAGFQHAPKFPHPCDCPENPQQHCLNHAETGSRCSEIKLLQCFISSNTIALVKPKEVLFLSCRRKTKREMNLAARSDRAISSNDQPLASQLPQ